MYSNAVHFYRIFLVHFSINLIHFLYSRFVHYGTSTLMSSKPLQYLLNTKLKIQLKNVDLIKKLMKHPHWKTASFNDIKKMLDYLLENFMTDEICQNIHIILYSR